jgi:hypothetical protein
VGDFLSGGALLLDGGRDGRGDLGDLADGAADLLDRRHRLLRRGLHAGDLATDLVGRLGGLGGQRLDLLSQLRSLSRQLILPISMMSQWCVSRSSMAVVIFASPNTCGQSAKASLVVISSGVFSYALRG